MNYKVQTAAAYHPVIATMGNEYTSFTEVNNHVTIDKDFSIQLYDVFTPGFHLKWGSYEATSAREHTVSVEQDSVNIYFSLLGSCKTTGQHTLSVDQNEFMVFHEKANTYQYQMGVNKENHGRFFELSIPVERFASMFPADELIVDVLHRDAIFAHTKSTFELNHLIYQLHVNPYKGRLKYLFWEAKTTELLLLISAMLKYTASSLPRREVDCLFGIREYIRDHFHENITIPHLARIAGLNETKLKQGYKQLFKTTIFRYITHLRMNKARELLLNEQYNINEVADLVGYKHGQHFTVAFKKKFGINPSELKK